MLNDVDSHASKRTKHTHERYNVSLKCIRVSLTRANYPRGQKRGKRKRRKEKGKKR